MQGFGVELVEGQHDVRGTQQTPTEAGGSEKNQLEP